MIERGKEGRNTNQRPSNEGLIDVLFGDMKKMNSVIERLTREITQLRIEIKEIREEVNGKGRKN